MDHLTLNLQPSDSLWYTPMDQQQQQLKPYTFFHHNNNHNNNYDDADSDNTSSIAINNTDPSETASSTTTTIDKDHMFEKPLTPSDVGKLNRLVIPKQHAEKYFPLAAATTAGGGLLLGFEDESGKSWKFRYSYWNSSQSYVLTKGWSRYVKDKKLNAGDVVFFERHRFHPDRFFIGWRRRGSIPPVHPTSLWTAYNFNRHANNNNNNNNQQQQQQHGGYNNHHHQDAVHQISAFADYIPHSAHPGSNQGRQKVKSGINSRRVRLFGVNLECQLQEEDDDDDDDHPQTSDGSSLSSQCQGLGSGLPMGPTSYNYYDYMGYPS